MTAALPLLAGPLLLAGGVDPEDASPGIGAFITFIILAAVIVLLAWSFTRHQRKIRANAAARRAQLQQEAESGATTGPGGTGAGEAPGTGSPDAPEDATEDGRPR